MNNQITLKREIDSWVVTLPCGTNVKASSQEQLAIFLKTAEKSGWEVVRVDE